MPSSARQRIAILGSTGSIGTSSLDVIARFPDIFEISYLTVNKNISLLSEQVRQFKPRGVVVLDQNLYSECKKMLDGTVEVLSGTEGLSEIVRRDDVDTVISALVGFAGLLPTVASIRAGKKIALANKETLVVAGEIIIPLAKENNVPIIPVDSEHSAIFQCLVGESSDFIHKIILTASGGPFRSKSRNELAAVTVAEALSHPNWKMGSKITIDSATLMNKGLEVIEAHWLFGLPKEKIEVVIHPQSIIHSMVEFIDGSVKAQLGIPDMKIPIQYALSYPDRFRSENIRVDFPKLHTMSFFQPDLQNFRCLQLAFDAMDSGGTMPAVLNAANEVAVAEFLAGRISFMQIPELIERAMNQHRTISHPSIEEIIETDRETRVFIKEELRQAPCLDPGLSQKQDFV